MFEIVFLGTSASAPSIQRGLSSQIVLYKDYRFMVDCGEGTQRQILRSGVGFRRLDKVLLTHHHLDHILGLGGLISTFAHWETVDRMEIWGGRLALERVDALLNGVVLRETRTRFEIALCEVKPGLIMDEDGFSVSAFQVKHRGPDCYGYVFEQAERRPFLVEQAEALGVPPSPLRRDLANGRAVTLPDGRVVQPDQVLGPAVPGVKLCITGDYTNAPSLLTDIAGADVLVSEATFMEHEAGLARQFGHVTARQAAELALEGGVSWLVLSHISNRYRERDLLEEARAVFPNTIVARDLDHFRIRRGQPLERIEEPQHA